MSSTDAFEHGIVKTPPPASAPASACKLEMPLVLEPMADVDDEDHEEHEDRQPEHEPGSTAPRSDATECPTD